MDRSTDTARGPGDDAPDEGLERRRLSYPVVCAVLGLVAGWLPLLLHGPIPEKFNIRYIQGSVAVWAYYSARLLIGALVGITWWPAPWYLRGPLCGVLCLLPVTFIALAMPDCGWT